MARHYQDYEQISGIFNNPSDLESLVETLYSRGVKSEDISILMSDKTKELHFAPKEETKAPEGTVWGGVSGGVLGAIIGGLTVVGTVLIPGVGLLVAGPLIGALAGGAVGATAGGIVGALIGVGIPEHEAKFYEDALKQEGNSLAVVHVPKDLANETRAVFDRCNAQHVKVHK